MDYIDRDTAIRTAIEMCVKVVGHGITQIDAVNIANAFEDIPTADVVPKSEVDILKSLITRKEEDAYNKGYEDGKADSIKELFESFDEICKGVIFTPTSYTLWQELKKKYTEGEQ